MTADLQTVRSAFLSRAAEAMLRAVGGCEVRLLLPSPVAVDATAQQLGMATVVIEEVAVAPVVVQRAPRSSNGAPAPQFELLFSAGTLMRIAGDQQAASAEELFLSARGVMFGEKRLRVVDFSVEYFAGGPYLYRVAAEE